MALDGSRRSYPLAGSELEEAIARVEADGTPSIEVEHVRRVYDRIARKWHGTRYKAWPRVEAFVRERPRGSLIADVGAGNGKNLPACQFTGAQGDSSEPGPSFPIASDISMELAKIAAERGFQVVGADVTRLPFRSGAFECVLCIAVLHHLSTRERRLAACAECCRLLAVGGRALFYAWAQEQEGSDAAGGGGAGQASSSAVAGGYSGHRFSAPDVLVPFHVPKAQVADDGSANSIPAATERAADAKGGGTSAWPAHDVHDDAKGTIVFQRYCHVYCRGELEELFGPLVASGEVEIEETWYDCGNWCAVVQRL